MRLTSVLVLAAVVLGIGYVAIFQQAWIKEMLGQAKGYHGAKTPQEALDYFAKAIKDRDYDTAAKYVEGTYAKELKRAHAKARELALTIDSIQEWLENKAFKTKKIAVALHNLDPFPKNFHPGKVGKEEGDNAVGEFISEPVSEYDASVNFLSGPPSSHLDLDMLTNVLGFVWSNPNHPVNPHLAKLNHNFAVVKLVKVGEADSKSWKIKFDCNNAQQEAIGYYLDRQPRYQETLSKLNREMSNQRYESRSSLEKEMMNVLAQAK